MNSPDFSKSTIGINTLNFSVVSNSVFSVFLTSVILNLALLEFDNAIVYFLFTAEACTLYVLLTYCLSILSTTQLFCSGLIFNVAAILVSVDFLAFVIIFLIACTVLLSVSGCLYVSNLFKS